MHSLNSSTTHAAYRPDIDGLRAIAVLAVVGFHASSRIVPGGFVGVDIFFVISGYLISSLIFQRLEAGNFSFSDFYKRRIKRILPAYIVVSLATLVFSSYLLIPNDYIFYTTSLAASWGFASNIFFSMLSWGYFGQRTEEFPLLHTWSLSVEEQFYFIFPIICIALFRYSKNKVILFLLFSVVVFVTLSELKTGKVGSYFILTYRAHELIIGALTYLLLSRFPIKSRVFSNILAIAGMIMLFGSLFLFDRKTVFPGINSLIPCLAVALLIYSCHIENCLSSILKNKFLVFIGLISYPLYLWHWPIFSFLRYGKIEITPLVGAAAVFGAFILATLTWQLVELPIRYKHNNIDFKKAFIAFYAVPALFFLTVGIYSYATEGAPKRFPEDIRQLISSYSFERDLTRACSIKSDDDQKITINYLLKNCAFGDMHQEKAQLLLMGDSHANHFKPFVEYLSSNANIKSLYHVQGSCSPIDVVDSAAIGKVEPSTCQKRNADLLQMASHFKFIAIAGFWSYKGSEIDFEKKLELVIEKIMNAGATPVVFKDNPNDESDLSQCILFRKRGWIAAEKNCNIPYRVVMDAQGRSIKFC